MTRFAARASSTTYVRTRSSLLVMATKNQIALIVHSFEIIEQSAKSAWDQVSPVAENVSEPTIGRATGFLPSELCYKVMSLALEEYLQKV